MPDLPEHSTERDTALFALADKLGLRFSAMIELSLELNSGFVPAAYGFPEFARIRDRKKRAIFSDEITQAAAGVFEHLLEGALFLEMTHRLLDGGRSPYRQTDLEAEIREHFELRMAISGTVNEIMTAFDCLSTCAIGVLGVQMPLREGSELRSLHKNLPNLIATAKSVPDAQRDTWGKFLDLLNRHTTSHPPGWFDWLRAMRNASVHRAFPLRIWVGQGPLPEGDDYLTAPVDLFLRRHPDVGDMQAFATWPVEEFLIIERAQATLDGVLKESNALLEDASRFLLTTWRAYVERRFVPPKTWRVVPAEVATFKGFAPASTRIEAEEIMGEEYLLARFQVGDALRRELVASTDDDAPN